MLSKERCADARGLGGLEPLGDCEGRASFFAPPRPGGRRAKHDLARVVAPFRIETMRWILREIDLFAVNGGADRLPQAVAALSDGSLGGLAIGVQVIGLDALDSTIQGWSSLEGRDKILVRPSEEWGD